MVRRSRSISALPGASCSRCRRLRASFFLFSGPFFARFFRLPRLTASDHDLIDLSETPRRAFARAEQELITWP